MQTTHLQNTGVLTSIAAIGCAVLSMALAPPSGVEITSKSRASVVPVAPAPSPSPVHVGPVVAYELDLAGANAGLVHKVVGIDTQPVSSVTVQLGAPFPKIGVGTCDPRPPAGVELNAIANHDFEVTTDGWSGVESLADDAHCGLHSARGPTKLSYELPNPRTPTTYAISGWVKQSLKFDDLRPDATTPTSTSPRVHVLTVASMAVGGDIAAATDYRINGVAQTTNRRSGNGQFQSFASANFTYVGDVSASPTVYPPVGDAFIAEAPVYDRALTPDERTAAETALETRYGIH